MKDIYYVLSDIAIYEALLRRSIHDSVHYSTTASQFTQTLSKAKWKGRTLVQSVILFSLFVH